MNHSKTLTVALVLALAIQLPAQNTRNSSVELTKTLSGHTGSIESIEFSHDGATLATSSNDRTVRLWRVSTGESLAILVGDEKSELLKLNWSNDDRRLALTYRRKGPSKYFFEVIVWEVTANQPPVIGNRFKDAYFLEWNANNRMFLAFDQTREDKLWRPDYVLKVWDAVSGQPVNTFSPQLTDTRPTMTFVADGTRILTASTDAPAQLWDVSTGKLIDTYTPNTQIPGPNFTSPVDPGVGSNKRFFISGNVLIYEAVTGQFVTSIKGGGSALSFSPDGKSVLTIRYDLPNKSRHRQSYLSLQKIESGEELSTFQVPEGVWNVEWSPDGSTIAIVGLEFNTRLVDAATGREKGRLPYGNCWPWQMFGSDNCEPLRFSADGTVLLKEKQPIKLWDMETVTLIKELKTAKLPAVFSPMGRLLATRSDDKKSVLLWRF